MSWKLRFIAVVAASACSLGCGDDIEVPAIDAGADGSLARPDTYDFESRFVPGESAVSYSGQVFRQTLISALSAELLSWTDRVYVNQEVNTAEQWIQLLDFYFRFDANTSLTFPIDLGLALPTLQSTWGDISGGANLIDKIAGQDDATDHKDWDGDGMPAGAVGGFVGWSEGSATTPLELVDYWFGIVALEASARAAQIPNNPVDGAQIEQVFITTNGQDIRQLIQKFLLGAITFSQATDDYLDSGTTDKGLESANLQDGANPYSTLEHTWDEGLGYFGARRDYNQHEDSDNGDPGYGDTDGDGMIDLKSELNSGMSRNAAKRDSGSQTTAKTDFSSAIFEALVTGRHIIWMHAGSPLPADARLDLDAQRDIVVDTWERVFGATVIHYINETITEMTKMGTLEYSFTEHAKVWSELKGFALAFQFNPRSTVSDSDFAMLHTLIRDAPELTMANLAAYQTDLETARSLLQDAFGFDAANVAGW